MARISVDSSAVSHNKNGEGGGVTYVMGGSSKSGSYNSLTVQSINAANGNIDYLKSKSISANDMSMIYISAVDGTIQKLKGSSANFDQGYFSALGADTIDANKLTVKDIDAINAWIETLQSREITTEYLTVTKQAHFFELIIDKIRSVGGQLIITPASCTVDYVWGVDSNGDLIPATPDNYSNTDYYDIFWRTTQDDGRSVTNDWIVNDQAICQSFNNVSEGVNYDVANKYYWRLVTQVSGITPDYDDVWVNLSTGALSNSANNPACNEFEVIMYKTTSILDNQTYDNNISWGCKAQTINGIETNVSWTNGTLGTDEVVHGIFKSASQLYGIQIEPTITENLPATTNFQLQIKQKGADDTYSIIPEKINIAVYFTDDTFLMWNDVSLDANGNFFFNMPDANSAIKSIIVNSTEDVKWHKCHRIRVSNNYIPKDEQHPTVPANNSGCDYVVVESASVPSIGDNLIQLGYRGNDDQKRQSAIIIAAYMTPDKELTCPSYAHYIGINDFHLSDHRHSYFDANGAKFLGDITLANVGDMTAKDKWMKLNVASSPIEIFYTNGTRSAIGPTVYSLNITTINDNGETVTLTSVPTGYKVFIYYYGLHNKLSYGPDSRSAGESLSGLTAPNTVEINNVATDVYKIECVLVKGTNAAANIIDKASIEYGMNTWFDTDSWCLIPKKEVAYATILDAITKDGEGYVTNNVELNVDLQYGIGHYVKGAIENGQFNYNASTNPNGFRLEAHAYYQSSGYSVLSEYMQNNQPYNRIIWAKSVNNTICSFNADNYLATLWPNNPGYWDYMKNYEDYRDVTLPTGQAHGSVNPVMIVVNLIKNNEVLDSRTVYVSMQSGAVQKLTNDKWVSAISESKTYTNSQTGPLGEAIDANARAIESNTSLIRQTANDITTWVQQTYATTSALDDAISTTTENLESKISQTAGEIRSEVNDSFSTVNGKIDGITGDISEINGDIATLQGAIDGMTGAITGATEAIAEILGTKLTQTASMLRSEAKRSYWHSGSHLDSSDPSTTIDLTGSSYDQARYYCVTITPSDHSYSKKHVYNFQVERSRGSEEDWGKPNWGSQSAPYGVDLMLNWTIITGAGNTWTDAQKYVNEYFLQWATGKVIGDIGIDASDYKTYFYVRGGSKYVVRYSEAATVSVDPNDDDTRIDNEPVIYTPTESSIEQTAERISLSVMELDGVSQEQLKRTGIDITNGKIELNAENTDVNGNLNIKGTTTGLTLYDSNDNPRVNILADTLPDPTSADGGFSGYKSMIIESQWYTKSPSANVNGTTAKYSIGTYANGNSLNMSFRPIIPGILRDDQKHIVQNYPTNLTCTAKLYVNGSSTASYTTTAYVLRENPYGKKYYYPPFTWSLNSVTAGTYEVELNINAPESANGYTTYRVVSYLDYTRITESLTYVGLDGLLVGTSDKHYAKISKDGYELRWTGITGNTAGGDAFRMDDSGFKRTYGIDENTGPVNWVAFDGFSKATVLKSTDFQKSTATPFYCGNTPVTNKYYYIVQATDTSIFIPQDFEITGYDSEIYIRLGNGIGGTTGSTGIVPGRKIVIRNFSEYDVRICHGAVNTGGATQPYHIINRNGNDPLDWFSAEKHSFIMMTIPMCHSSKIECHWAIMHRD